MRCAALPKTPNGNRYAARKQEELSAALQNLQNGEDSLRELQEEVRRLREAYIAAASKLSEKRIKTAAKLDKSIMRELPPLKMEKPFSELP